MSPFFNIAALTKTNKRPYFENIDIQIQIQIQIKEAKMFGWFGSPKLVQYYSFS